MFRSASRLVVVLSCLTVLCLVLRVDTEQVAASSFEDGLFNGKPYKLFIPSSYDEAAEIPLVVMLHGCTQNAADFAAGTEMNTVAEQEGFIVLYPEQPSSANLNHCWNWFEPTHQERGTGEPATINGMVNQVKGEYTIDDESVYASGLSAGGAMAVILGATYPDTFTAIGIGSGLEYKAATNLMGATTAMLNGGPNPATQAERAFEAMGDDARVVPAIVVHGSDDWTVRPVNGDQVTEQWVETNNFVYQGSDHISKTPEAIQHQVPNGRSYTQYLYKNTKGETIVEKYIVNGMGHAWSGGSLQGSYTDPQGPHASEIMWEFFKSKSEDDQPDEENPTTVANPPGGEYIGSVNVELTADSNGTTYYTIDGSNPTIDSPVYTDPIFIDTTTELKFFTVDDGGNKEEVKTEIYTIKDADDDNETDIQSIAIQSTASGFVGRYTVDGRSNQSLKIGDKGMFNTDTYRTILSFDTSPLADLTISSVKLVLFTKTSTGAIDSITVDAASGHFGSSPQLEQSDFLASATTSSIVSIENIPTMNGKRMEFELPLDALNRDGITQFRLKAGTAARFNNNLLELYKEENPDYIPRLELEVHE